MKRETVPCMGCEFRTENCHAGCGKYASWKKQEDERNAEIRAKKKAEKEVDTYTMLRTAVIMKKMRKDKKHL